MSAAGPGGRWVMSFADLCLLLLGFFVLMQARSGDPGAVADGVRQAFGAGAPATERLDLPAATLFQPGEAVLKPDARARFAAIGRNTARRGAGVRVESVGRDPDGRRFDGWELAAARTAAVARAVRAGGLAEDRIEVAMPAMAAGPAEGQALRVGAR